MGYGERMPGASVCVGVDGGFDSKAVFTGHGSCWLRSHTGWSVLLMSMSIAATYSIGICRGRGKM